MCAENGVEREVMPEQVTPTHHTLCQRIAVFGGVPEEMQREGECFGVGVVGEEHTTGVGFETRIGLFETGWEVAHESWGKGGAAWRSSDGKRGEAAEIFVFPNKYLDGREYAREIMFKTNRLSSDSSPLFAAGCGKRPQTPKHCGRFSHRPSQRSGLSFCVSWRNWKCRV